MKEYRVTTAYSMMLAPAQPCSGWFRDRSLAEQCMAQLTAKGYSTNLETRNVEDDEDEDDD